MITAIEIENFKGIGSRQRIELAPITLLFGANSSGKSTIIHALHYALEVLEGHNCDAERTRFGGEFIDLGGFRNFVHGRDLQRRVTMRFELDLRERSLPTYGEYEPDFSIFDEGYADRVERTAVEFQVAWDHQNQVPIVARYAVDLNGERFAALETDVGRRSTVLAELNWNHPVLREEGDEQAEANQELQDLHSKVVALHEEAAKRGLRKDPPPYLAFGILHSLASKAFGVDDADVQPSPGWGVAGPNDALPAWGEVLEPALPRPQTPPSSVPDSDAAGAQARSESERKQAAEQFAALLTQLLVGPGELLTQTLASTRYLGPLREKPLRSHDAQHVGDAARWASGLAAWDALFQRDVAFLTLVSDWLSRSDRLGAGISLTRGEYREIALDDPVYVQLAGAHAFDDLDLADVRDHLRQIPVRRRIVLVDETSGVQYQPFDVGEGISQLIPVVVALLAPTEGIVAIEQPELHVHPAIQVGLGDLIAFGMGQGALRLIETHSEHLLLRLLRRIRETGEDIRDNADFALTPDDVAIWYVEVSDGATRATRLRVDASGEFLDRWPKGFFEERASELF